MSSQKLRYVFTDYKNIGSIKLKKLEKLCQKLFILIDASEEYIPLHLVRNIQRFGKSAKWIPIHESDKTLDYHIIYMMGKMHDKIDKEIEFAVLSENEELNGIIRHINQGGRRCIRIRIIAGKTAAFNPDSTVQSDSKPVPESDSTNSIDNNDDKAPIEPKFKKYSVSLSVEDQLVNAAHSTIERLQRLPKDHRAYNRDALLTFIQIANQQLTEDNDNGQKIIGYLSNKGYINFTGDIVEYNLPTLNYPDKNMN